MRPGYAGCFLKILVKIRSHIEGGITGFQPPFPRDLEFISEAVFSFLVFGSWRL